MLAGGDYSPQGLRGCGIQNALKAAKAELGKSLCRREDQRQCRNWRDKVLVPFLKKQSIKIAVPAQFPNFTILRELQQTYNAFGQGSLQFHKHGQVYQRVATPFCYVL